MDGWSSFLASLAIQRRVLHALMMREVITRFGRENLGVLWLVGEPMLFTLGVTALWTAAGLERQSAIPIVAFAITGYSSVLMWRNTVSHSISAIEQNKNLLYHRNVNPIDTLLARVVLEICGATGSFIILSLFFISIGWIHVPEDPLEVLLGWVMLAWFGTSLAFLIGSAAVASDLVERLWQPVSYLLFPMSGAAFMVEWLPNKLQEAVLLLPMVHGVEMLRQGYFGNVVRTHYDLGYMATFCLLLSLAGMYAVRVLGHKLEF